MDSNPYSDLDFIIQRLDVYYHHLVRLWLTQTEHTTFLPLTMERLKQ